MYKKVVLVIISTGILLLNPVYLFSRGRQEDPIRQARELVAENRINEAILLLEQTVRDDPERIQQAESLLRTIREIRGRYNSLFDELIDNLVNNPDDIERTLRIIDEMESLDEFPNKRVVEQIEDARIVAQLAYDRSIVEQRMDAAQELLAADDYKGVVDVYLSLRNLQRRRFEDRGYGDIFVNTVNSVVARIPEQAEVFFERLGPYRKQGDLVRQAAGGNDLTKVGQEELTSFYTEAVRMYDVIGELSHLAGDVALVRSQVALQFPNDPVDWYLTFQDIIIRGRPAFRGVEGLTYAVEEAYQDSLTPLVEAGLNRTEELLVLADGEARTDRYPEAGLLYEEAGQNARLWKQAEAGRIGLFETDTPPAWIVASYPPDSAEEVLWADGVIAAIVSLADLSEIMTAFVQSGGDAAADDVDDTDVLPVLVIRKTETNRINTSLQAGQADWKANRQVYETIPEEYLHSLLVERLTETDTRWTDALQRTVSRERNLVKRIAFLKTETVPDSITEFRKRLSQTKLLNDGVSVPISDIDDGFRVLRYPDEALAAYQEVLTEATNVYRTVEEAIATVQAEPGYVRAGDVVADAALRLDELEGDLAAIIAGADQGVTVSRELIAQSEMLIDEAVTRTADMRAAISSLQVDAARNNFNTVREAYFESLELREDPEFRRVVDARIQALGDELRELENVVVIQRVRELLTRANNLYNQDKFVIARDALIEAQQTWEQTNIDTNTEIERLLRLVTAALSLEEGRDLAITDPLYPILSNYLSIAREDYNRAVSLYNSGRETQAEPLFDRVIENLRNVRDVRPLNWEARILELRIAQIRNADDFESVFATRYQQALDRLDKDGPLEVYGELEVLAEINPDYPGIQNQIRRLEIALNLRPDPVDAARRQQASTIYQRARELSTGTRDQVMVAVSLLENAIQLDPTNGQAAFLLDQLRIRLGGQATVALTTNDEQQFRRAETLFSQDQALQAFSIVERLLQDQENRNYPPLVDLRRRIALRLGI